MLYRLSKTNLIACFILMDTVPSLGIDSSDDLQWITTRRTIHTCKGYTLDLNWEFDVKGKEIRTLEWYFNDILICYVSGNDDFKVEPPYKDRIERVGKLGIRLKNISLDDEGTFTLLPVLFWSTSESMQSISLQVSEPPTDMCMVKIRVLGNTSKLMCDFSSSDCGGPHMSALWKRGKTFDVLGEGNYLEMNSSFYGTEILCCLQGKAMNCVGDSSNQLCASLSLSANESQCKPGNNIMLQVPNGCDSDWSKRIDPYSFIPLVICVIVNFVATAFSVLTFRQVRLLAEEKKEMCKDKEAIHTEQSVLHKARYQDADSTPTQLSEESHPMLELKDATWSSPIKLSVEEYETEATNKNQPSSDSATMRELQELRYDALCKICLLKKMNMVLIPCKHAVTCENCGRSLRKCPVCSMLIKDKMNISFG